jgi:hypothetical protein
MVRDYIEVGLDEAAPGPLQVPETVPTTVATAGTQRKRMKQNEGIRRESTTPDIRVYCPYALCAARDEPTLRLLRIVEDHLKLHLVNEKYEVDRCFSSSILYFPPNSLHLRMNFHSTRFLSSRQLPFPENVLFCPCTSP